jgi:hypothetical protein
VEPTEWRERVGQYLEARRLELGYSSRYQICEDVDLSEPWVRQMETGTVKRNDGSVTVPNPRGNKVHAYTRRLRWEPDAVDRLLAGEAPKELDDEPTPPWEELLEGQRELNVALREVRDELRRGREDTG